LAITKESIIESQFNQTDTQFAELSSKSVSVFDLFFERITQLKNPDLSCRGADKKDTLVQVLRSNSRRNLMHIQNSMEESTNRAVSYCYFTTPYFLPYGNLKKAIINASKRGVDVRILTAGLSDAPLSRLASHHIYQSFLEQGVRIFEMHKKTLHAKMATIDGIFSSIGSYNLDHWSARRNLEVNMSIIDSAIARELKAQFEKDLTLSLEVEGPVFATRSWIKKAICWLSYWLMRL
jgi:cardiolipin synthase